MSRFIQVLESRTLLSATPVTKATLLADQAVIVSNAVAAKADLKVLAAGVGADTKAIQADLKGLPKTNLPLLRTLKVDEAMTRALITKDLHALLNPGVSLARRSTAAGIAQIRKATTAVVAKVVADVAALQTVTAAPLATLQAAEQGNAIDTDLQALVAANPTDATLAADVAKLQSDASTNGGTFDQAAMTFQTGIATVAVDVAAAPANSGGTTTIPNLVGTLTGSATVTAGNNVGQVSQLTIHFTSEGADGSLAGDITVTNTSGGASGTITASVTAGGAFSATVVTSDGTTTLSGTVVGKTISGTHSTIGGDSGTFHVTLQ